MQVVHESLVETLGGRVDEVKRIAVLRANGIGDYLMALPALQALRTTYHDAEITLLAQPWHARALARRPGPVDRVEVVPATLGLRGPEPGERPDGPADADAFFERMRERRFDLGVQMHGGGRESNPFMARLEPRVSIGSRAPDAGPLDRAVPYRVYQNEIARLLEVASLAGAPPVTLVPRWRVTAEDRAALAQTLATRNGAGMRTGGRQGRLAVIAPTAGDPRRRWPSERFAEVADALAEKGACIVICGDVADRGRAHAVGAAMRYSSESVAGLLTLGGLGALLERADLFIGNDSGPAHLARAVGTPSVTVFWCGNALTAGPLGNARDRTAISWRLECPSCGVNCITGSCAHQSSFVSDVTVDEVRDQALDLWATNARSTGAHAPEWGESAI